MLTAEMVRTIVREELERAPTSSVPEVLTREQCAQFLQVEPHTVTRWVRAKGLPGVQLGGK